MSVADAEAELSRIAKQIQVQKLLSNIRSNVDITHPCQKLLERRDELERYVKKEKEVFFVIVAVLKLFYCSVTISQIILTLRILRLTRNIYSQSISATERERKIMQRHQAVDTAVAMMSLFGDKSDDSDEHDISRMHFQSCM